ncbi:MAG: septal ring lytic transglycosylase RlpA family protein [Ignavibacteria bacterium]|jgi:hypothetical protein|nr:septal ring lytic transglycosylase RlpA family protein [Ignavibacteria bacterium]
MIHNFFLNLLLFLTIPYFVALDSTKDTLEIKTNEAESKATTSINVDQYLRKQTGIASYYAHKFHNRRTASGEIYDMYGYTAAHKKIAFGTIVKVTNPINDKSVLVKVNDRGPFKKSRIFDLSYRAAKEIDGLCTPKIELTYFNFKKLKQDLDTHYLLGHSISDDFVILHREQVEICDSIETANFEEVVNAYLQHKQISDDKYYIFTKNHKPRKKNLFYIGTSIIDDIDEAQ